MAEITRHMPIEDAAVLLETDIGERFKLDGFKGLRRVEIKKFATPFFIGEDNPNGTIESFPDDLPKDKMVPMMDLYLSQGKFGTDPFNLRPQDKMADLQRQIEELRAVHAGPKANPENTGYKPPPPISIPVAMETVTSVPIPTASPEDVKIIPLEDMAWHAFRKKAEDMGIKTYKKTRTVITAEIEGREAE